MTNRRLATYHVSTDRIVESMISGRTTHMTFIYRNGRLVGQAYADTASRALAGAIAQARAARRAIVAANKPAVLDAEVIRTTGKSLVGGTLYAASSLTGSPYWLDIADGRGQNGHTASLRVVSNHSKAMHPAGWPICEDFPVSGFPASYGPVSPLKLTASDLSALESGLEDVAYQMHMTETRYGVGSGIGTLGTGY